MQPFGWVLDKMHITRKPIVKVYHGYGDVDALLVYGHVFMQSPLPRITYRNNLFINSFAMARMFMAKPYPNVRVSLKWGNQIVEAITDKDGFFKLEWKSELPPDKGWHIVKVDAIVRKGKVITGEGKILIPHSSQYAFISDIDDTFLVSHSSNLRKRMYVLLTKNARSRKPFDGVVHHYQKLATSNIKDDLPNPFFFVSSSEWNLYDYIKEFCRNNSLPEGVYLLNQLKQWNEFLKTGQGKHTGKFMRIARLMKEFPSQKFVLLGDDTQEDPVIYTAIVESFPEQIIAVYWRNVRADRRASVQQLVERVAKQGVQVCYFQKSTEAMEHSRRIGLINN